MLESGPKFIKVEETVAQLVRSFRNGVVVRDLIPDAPHMELNADYYFPNDSIVAELKCLHADVEDQETVNRRFLSVCKRLGYSPEYALRIAFREVPIPREVACGVVRKALNHVGNALKKANDQIAATKKQLGCPNALGLAIVSNENNVATTPAQLIDFISGELQAIDRHKGGHIDGVIYMTPNIYYPVGQDGVMRSLWLPGYRRAGAPLTEFVDEFGAAWCRLREKMDVDFLPSVRTHEPRIDQFDVWPTMRASQ